MRRNFIKPGNFAEYTGSDHMEYTDVTGEHECRREIIHDKQNK